jgi:hypothetical protein
MSLAMIGRGSGPVVLARWWDALIAAKTSLGRLIARRQELECVGGRREGLARAFVASCGPGRACVGGRREGLARAFVTSCGPGRLGGRGRVRGLFWRRPRCTSVHSS